jgi:hypothetical protein
LVRPRSLVSRTIANGILDWGQPSHRRPEGLLGFLAFTERSLHQRALVWLLEPGGRHPVAVLDADQVGAATTARADPGSGKRLGNLPFSPVANPTTQSGEQCLRAPRLPDAGLNPFRIALAIEFEPRI